MKGFLYAGMFTLLSTSSWALSSAQPVAKAAAMIPQRTPGLSMTFIPHNRLLGTGEVSAPVKVPTALSQSALSKIEQGYTGRAAWDYGDKYVRFNLAPAARADQKTVLALVAASGLAYREHYTVGGGDGSLWVEAAAPSVERAATAARFLAAQRRISKVVVSADALFSLPKSELTRLGR